MDHFFSYLNVFEDLIWDYLGFPVILLLGTYLTIQSRFAQIQHIPKIFANFCKLFSFHEKKGSHAVHPLKAFFAAVGGCIGIGNIVAVCTAIQIGGPGALLWIWITAILGVMLKYAEVYLGMRYRVSNSDGSYTGGPMFYLQKAFKSKWIPGFVALLLCIYGVEIWQFSIVADSVSHNLNINYYLIAAVLLGLVLFAVKGGVERVGKISEAVIPLFVVLYIGMGSWILFLNLDKIPAVLLEVVSSAFTGHAAVGGFVGSTLLMVISQGIRRGCYTGDYGIGYAAVIHSESMEKVAEKQASLVFVGIFLDTFVICTMSILIILITGVWTEPVDASLLIQMALEQYFPYMNVFIPFFLFLLGYSTINAYFCFGAKSAEFLSPTKGTAFFYIYAIICFVLFSFVDSPQAQTVMTIVGGLLLVINSIGIFKLRHEISYDF